MIDYNQLSRATEFVIKHHTKKGCDYEIYDENHIHSEEFEEPLLLIDINLGKDKKAMVALFEDSNPAKIARRFSVAKGLDPMQS